MNTFRLLATLCGLLTATCLFSQSGNSVIAKPDYPFLSAEYLPDPSPEMPDWAMMLYDDNLNLFELETAVERYWEDSNSQSAAHRPWIKYARQLSRSAWPYLLPDGRIRSFSDEESIIQWSQAQLTRQRDNAMAGNWTHVGPKETFWREEHRPGQPVAPWQVNVYSFDIATANPSILYAGTETGALFKTNDKGVSWEMVAPDFRFGSSLREVAIAPSNPVTVMVSSGNSLFRTTDGGTNWTNVLTVGSLNCDHLEIDPSDAQVVLAATGQGLYRTTNGGNSWAQSLTGYRVYSVDYKADDPSVVFALTRENATDTYKFFKSTDSGVSFTEITNGWVTGVTEGSGARMAVSSADANFIYVVLLTNGGPFVLRSTDAGDSWEVTAGGGIGDLDMDNGQGFYDLDIVASATNAQEVIVATTTAYRSVDAGVTYTAVGGYSGNFDIHPDIQRMRSVGTDSWIATDGGMNYSVDFFADPANFEARIDGMIGTEFWGYHQGWNQDLMVGGRYHNGNTAFGEMFPAGKALRMGGGESATGWVMHNKPMHTAFSDLGDGIILSEEFSEPAVGRFPFNIHPTEGSRGFNASVVLTDPRYYETYYVGNASSLYRTTDGGANYSTVNLFGTTVRKMAISWDDPDVIFVFTDGGFFRTDDAGVSWSTLTLPSGFNNLARANLCLDPNDADRLWIVNPVGSNGNKVYRSDNAGNSWNNITTTRLDDRNFINIAHGGNASDHIYISSWGGVGGYGVTKVFYRGNSNPDWTDYSDGLPAAFNPLKTIPFYRDGKLRIAGNRGVYETPLADPNVGPYVQPTVNVLSSNCTRDTFLFDDYSILNHNNAIWSWSFPGATYVSAASVRNPKVVYENEGTFTATLTVTQGGNSISKDIVVSTVAGCEPDVVPGLALALDGDSESFASITPPATITNTLTVTAWLKPNGNQNSFAGIVFQRDGNGNTWGFNFRNNNELGFHWDGPAAYNWSTGLNAIPDEWNHVALVVEPNQTRIYLNGELATRSITNTPKQLLNIALGADRNFGSRRYNGLMDEVTLWNRSLTTAELRETMHLTKVPDNDPDLIHYYQFNEEGAKALDRSGGAHATLQGGSSRVSSTGPFGGGTFDRQTVNVGGQFDFADARLQLTFPATGTFPDGDVVVSHITATDPDQPAGSGNQVQDQGYWVVENFGANENFTELEAVTFTGLSGLATSSPSEYHLYQRNPNADGNSWGNLQDYAESATFSSITFSEDNGIVSGGQFSIDEGAPLPVELISFGVGPAANGKDVEVSWVTALEINNEYFVVERSRDGISFEPVTRVASKNGNSQYRQQYAYLDRSPGQGTFVYRLKQVDVDGSFTYSSLKSVVLNLAAKDWQVYPSPITTGEPWNVITSIEGEYRLSIYDVKGRRVFDRTLSGNQLISTVGFKPGTYIYRMTGGGRMIKGRLIVLD